MSRILKITLTSIAGLAVSSLAHAGCMNGSYCTLAPTSHASVTSQYSSTASYMSLGSYQGAAAQTYGFSGSPASLPGLGYNESLRPTTCPTAVYNPNGGKVLGCYNVVKPVAQTSYYRIVRPVIYVRYPVPVAVPQYGYSQCGSKNNASRYGGATYGHSFGFRSNCR